MSLSLVRRPHQEEAEPRRLLLQLSNHRQEEEPELYFLDYVPQPSDSITLPPSVLYVLVGVALVVVATYAIVGHLIKDLVHDVADCILGPKPVEEDLEGGRGAATLEEEQQLSSVSGKVTEGRQQQLWMQGERDAKTPPTVCQTPPTLHPSRTDAVATSSRTAEKRKPAHSVTFACPLAPQAPPL